MAEILQVNKHIQPEDVTPNYEYQLQDVAIDKEQSDLQKSYFNMFLKENIDLIDNKVQNVPSDKLETYLSGMKEMMAFVFLWIDSLNAQDQELSDD